MIKFYTAFTNEIDDPEIAIEQIIEQLKPEENMLKNTLGIVNFYYEFADSGVFEIIADALPFELVGCVSSYIGMAGHHGDVFLSVTMITSDDLRFAVRSVEQTGAKSREQIADEITRICNDFGALEKPKLIMPFLTVLQHFSGDDLVTAVNSLPDTFPIFGTIAFNMENVAGTHYVLCNGKLSSDTFAFTAFYGDFEPEFHVTSSFDFDESFGNVAEITEADGPVLKMVNDVTVLEHLKKLGMITSDNLVSGSSIWAVPAVLTYPNGTRVVRAFLGIVEGTEYIFSTGTMETGAKITFAYLDGEKTLASAEKMFKGINESKENNIIGYSCAARVWSLGTNYSAEAQRIAVCADEYRQKNNVPLNYCVAYSGGEICPIVDNNGKLVNTLQNYTLIACSFR